MVKARKLSCEMDIFHDGAGIAAAVKSGKRYDLIFLDIEMADMDGLRAAKEIRQHDKAALIIYVSSYSQYAIEAYDVRPFQFMVKPVNVDRLENYFDAALEEILDDDVYFRYINNKQSLKVPVKEILYFESNLRQVNIVTTTELRNYREKLSSVEKVLQQSKLDFWRIHQSYLVNRAHIFRARFSEVEMSNGTVLPISPAKRDEIREKYFTHFENSIVE
jgi:DNA-binding LytR/AlgR family response regulator